MYKALGYDGRFYVGYYTKFVDAEGHLRHVIVEPMLKGSSVLPCPQIHEISLGTLEEIKNNNEKE